MINWLVQILRGVVIGVANIIPGVSGGTMMVSMGIYDTIIHSITHIFKEFWKSIKALLPYIIGMAIGLFGLATLISFLLENHPLPTNAAFIGLIFGGLSPLLAQIERKKINWVAVVAFVLMFALVAWMGLKNDIQNSTVLDLNVGTILLLVVLGAIASATMIIPGVSGSMVMMLLGYYTPVVNALSSFKSAVFAMDFGAMSQPFFTLLPFAIGIVLGIYGVARLIEWLTQRYPTQTYCGVLGLVLASPVAILFRTDMSGVTTPTILISVLTFAVGFVFALLLARSQKKHNL